MNRTERRETLAKLINLHHLMDELAENPEGEASNLPLAFSTEAEKILPGAGRLFEGE